MNNKKFTLTELIIAVIVISILASIVLVKILDMKNKGISAAVANNTKIIQTAVDRYSLDNGGVYPIKNNLLIDLQKPQLIDIELLKEKGYLKKELDTSKIKKQYYWLDIFGVAWGSTENTVNDISLVSPKDKNSRLEFITPTGAVAYRVYEVTGYNKSGNITNQKNRHYKLVSEIKLNKKRQKVNFEIPDNTQTYLISAIDKFQQETAPVGTFYRGSAGFEPILRGDGMYEFEIESFDEMFWVDYRYIQETPGNSTITYRFKVKDSNGVYGEWTDDYFSLASSTGIKVEVDMKSDEVGNKPSLYDLNIIYRYAYEELLEPPTIEYGNPNNPPSICPAGATMTTVSDEKWLEGPKLITYLVNLPKDQFINEIKAPQYRGYQIVNVRYEYANENGQYIPASGVFEIPSGSCVNIIYEVEKLGPDNDSKGNNDSDETSGSGSGGINSGSNKPFPDVVTCEEKCTPICEDCIPSCLENCNTKPNDPKDEPVVCTENNCIEPPICQEGDVGCIPPVCVNNCSEGPPMTSNPQDSMLTDSNWTTLETLRFFAHGPLGVPTRWIGMVPDHEMEEGKTRVVYRYAKSNGYYWSNEIEEINKVGQSRSLMVVAYLQIHKDVKGNANQKPPKVNSIRILHEKGEINLSNIQPTLAILPVKDNNKGRDVFSDESKIDWQYVAFDPRGRKITEIEWAGDKQEKYSVGSYTIKARVKNETELWSEWVSYQFDVLPEKPVAKITNNGYVFLDEKVEWSAVQSHDPDGDVIVKIEWRGDKQSIYNKIGNYSVGLRVQDSEGNWSEWDTFDFEVKDAGQKVYRLEAEDKNIISQVSGGHPNTWRFQEVLGEKYSGGKTLLMQRHAEGYQGSINFDFYGNGIELKTFNTGSSAVISIDNGSPIYISSTGEKLTQFFGLTEGKHTVSISSSYGSSEKEWLNIDYINIYSTEDKPEVLEHYGKLKSPNGNIEPLITDAFSRNSKKTYNLYVKSRKDSHATAVVKDSNNNVIKTIANNEFKEGGTINTAVYEWDGTANGSYVKSGKYILQVTLKGVMGKESTIIEKVIHYDNENPTYRIEGEDISKVPRFGVSNGSTFTVVKDSTSSSDNYLKMTRFNNNYTNYVTTDFSGVGMDVAFVNSAEAYIKVADSKGIVVSEELYSTVGSGKYALRKLPEGDYKLTITTVGAKTNGLDYIDVYNENDTPIALKIYGKPVIEGTTSNLENKVLKPSISDGYNLYFELRKDAYVSINLKDSKGIIVREINKDVYAKGGSVYLNSFEWDGKDAKGNILPDGNYVFDIKLKGVNKGLEINHQYNLVIDNSTAKYRAEGENNTLVQRLSPSAGSKYSVVKVDGASDSNVLRGQDLGISYYNAFAHTFSSVGTGLDIVFHNTVDVGIVIKNSTGTVIKSEVYSKLNNFGIYSLRNLPEDKYSITINTKDSGNTYLDYIDVY